MLCLVEMSYIHRFLTGTHHLHACCCAGTKTLGGTSLCVAGCTPILIFLNSNENDRDILKNSKCIVFCKGCYYHAVILYQWYQMLSK